ncbi:restriction endonuclease subunit S [Moraxella catarrhalis]|uniref:restriction endonuclease subunit S n=1 Tax=Moraxella catarrhalis TaxID=480 RepID=UPI00128AF821|nr:restriction endonuclease subunit S [Moraxella catarrhalis]MPY07766.1 restriction endonuclease subunit S [Moraxella catarrhalis]
MSEWQVQKLSDVIEIIGGGTPKRSEERYWNGDIDWLSVADFNNDFRFVTNSSEKITELGLKNSSTKLLQKGQLIISARGTVGCLAQLAKPMAFNQSCYGLNGIKDIIDNDFLYYFLKHNIGILKSKTHGSVFDTITRDTFEHIEINFPNLDKQKEIAEILGDFDKKIQLNTQTNQTLEAIAQAIFKSWFVDFDPVRAKAQAILDGKTRDEANLSAMAVISGKTIEDLSQTEYQELWEIADAFPSELVENIEFGEVPKGWEVRKIGEVLDTVGGATPSTKNNDFWENGDIYWTTPKDLSSLTDKILLDTERKITQAGLKKISSGLLPVNTVLLSSRAPVGYLALAKTPVAINQGYIAIKNSDILNCYYILQWCVANMAKIKSRASGTTFAEISKNTFREISIIIPNQEILNIFKNKLESFYDQITKNAKENINLSQTRDLLLPKLLSGEIEL